MKNFIELTKKWKLFFLPLAAIILVIIFFFSILIPRLQIALALREEVKSENILLEKLTTKANSLEGIDEASLKEKLDISLNAILDNKDVMKAVSLFKNLAQDKQVFVESINVSPGEIATETAGSKIADLEILDFNIKILGDWNRILEFFGALEEVVPLANITTLKINNSSNTSLAQINVETYLSPLPKVLGKIDLPIPKITTEEEGVLEVLEKFRKYEIIVQEFPSSSVSGVPRFNPFSL